MEKGSNRITNYILRSLGTEKIEELDYFIEEVKTREFLKLDNETQADILFTDIINEFIESLTEEEQLNLRQYTGYNFKNINAILRGNWTHYLNGILTEEKRYEYQELSDLVAKVIDKFPSLEKDLKTYRGISINSFKDYGIETLEDLKSMKGKYMYEQGFTSTSIIRDKSYFEKKLEWVEPCNIEIEYLIPEESKDGALLLSNCLSYSASQNEYLINKGSLSKVIDVEVEKDKARLKTVLIPKSKWNTYTSLKEQERQRS